MKSKGSEDVKVSKLDVWEKARFSPLILQASKPKQKSFKRKETASFWSIWHPLSKKLCIVKFNQTQLLEELLWLRIKLNKLSLRMEMNTKDLCSKNLQTRQFLSLHNLSTRKQESSLFASILNLLSISMMLAALRLNITLQRQRPEYSVLNL